MYIENLLIFIKLKILFYLNIDDEASTNANYDSRSLNVNFRCSNTFGRVA